MRQNDPESCDDLFVNDNMTQYNYSLLKELKSEKKKRKDSKRKSFDVLFVRDGKVFAKKDKESDDSYPIWISNMVVLKKFIESIENYVQDGTSNSVQEETSSGQHDV